MKAWFKGFVLSLVISIFLLSGIVYLDNQGYFILENLQVSFTKAEQAKRFPAMQKWKLELTEEMVEWKGVSMWELPMSELKAKISPLDWVENFSIQRRFPNKLKIELVPKKWIALLRTNKAKDFQGLSTNCERLPKVKMMESLDLPIVDLNSVDTKRKLKSVCRFLKSLSGNRVVSVENLAELRWGKDGLLAELISPQVQLRLGKRNYKSRSKRIERVLQHLEEKSLTPKVITASFQQKVVVKLRKAR